jgi:hypothetical protein
LINHPEANKKGEWVNSASYKKCKELFLQIEEFPYLTDVWRRNATDEWSKRKYSSPMIRIVLAVTTPSVLKMMKERIVRMVVNMKVSLLLRT